MNKINKIIGICKEIYLLSKVRISFKNHNNQNIVNYKKTYNYFTRPHRLKLFKNKTIGVALIDLLSYRDFEEYYKSINGKNSAAYYGRKALKREYKFGEIDRNNYIDDIYDINRSSEIRQGRKMSEGYLIKAEKYTDEEHCRYFGVLNSYGKLLAYCNICFYGEFALVTVLLGHKKYLNDGIMYLMMIEVNKIMFHEYREKGYKFIMYDTFFGASEGLKKFKIKLGYKPYKVKWIWEN